MPAPTQKPTPQRKPGRPNAEFFRKRAQPPAPKDPQARSVEAVIDAVVFSSADGAFSIMRGTDPAGDRVVLKGPLANIHVGESVTCEGSWKSHVEHGWSFQVESTIISEPHTVAGMVAYLESAVHGIGPVFAKAIVDTLGERAFEKIDADPSVLLQVKTPGGQGIGTEKLRAVAEKWEELRAIRKVMVFLTSHGVTPGLSGKIYKRYGNDSIRVMLEDPYRIVEIRGVGFRIADRIARNLGVPMESPRRIQAGLVYVLEEAEGNGHCYLTEEELAEQAVEQLMLEHDDVIREQLGELVRERGVVMESTELGNRVYLPELFFIERRLAMRVRELVRSMPMPDLDLPERPTTGDFVPNDGQWQAIENALTSRVSLITGLPGTGKTTLVKLLLDVIGSQPRMVLMPAAAVGPDEDPEEPPTIFELASPTGKAARRLAEATSHDAKTIHRLLKFAQGDGGFLHDENTPLNTRFVIVDETSMVDLKLADALVRAVGHGTHLVLVGDADQLPPVGAGKVFDDLIESGVVPSVRLTQIFRQAARSLIVRNAHRIVSGQDPYRNAADAAEQLDIAVDELDDDYFFVHRNEPEDVAELIVDFATRRIPQKYGLDPMRDVLVLAPMKRGPVGLEVLNDLLQERLNPNGVKLGVKGHRLGDRVIQTRNDYMIGPMGPAAHGPNGHAPKPEGVMNGEVAIITQYDREEGRVCLEIADRTPFWVSTSSLENFLPAYAISVHRSQGSQSPAVVCAVAKSHWIMLTRSLVNTAITRAQKLCVCVGQTAALKQAVRTVDARKRNSALAERVRA